MSAIPSDVRLGGELPRRQSTTGDRLPIAAFIFLAAVVGAAAAVSAFFLPRVDRGTEGWTAFLILASTAAVAHVFLVRTGKNQSYQTSIVFLKIGRASCRERV